MITIVGREKMTIDERLEKLTERHEALTQALMAAENRDRDQKWAKQMGDVMEGIARLLHVAEIREQRIERLEG
jgi:hypothetical protein